MIQVVKIGGNVIDDPLALEAFCRDFAALGGSRVLVHGGGALGSRMQARLGIEPVRIEGRRVTDAETLQVVTMVYAGWCNKKIVSLLQAEGCPAIGLSGCDGNVLCASKRAPLEIAGKAVDFGFVGDVRKESVNGKLLHGFLDMGLVPVLSPINHDGSGTLLNTNADTVASAVASALGAQLTVCFEKPGVLLDVNDPGSVIPALDPASYQALKAEGRIADGMIPKLDNAFHSLREGATRVTIKQASALLDPDAGTVIAL